MEVCTVTRDPISAHRAIVEGWQIARPLTLGGKSVEIIVREAENDKSIQQRSYYHGVILTEISQQVAINIDGVSVRYTLPVWKEYFREMFLGSKWELFTVPGSKRKKRRKVRVSSEDLGVRGYSKLIEQVIAHATTEWGVRFSVSRWQDYRA